MHLAVEVQRDKRPLSAHVVVHAVGRAYRRVAEEFRQLFLAGDDERAVRAARRVLPGQLGERALGMTFVPGSEQVRRAEDGGVEVSAVMALPCALRCAD